LEKTLKREKIMFEKRKRNQTLPPVGKVKKAKCILRIFPKREEKSLCM